VQAKGTSQTFLWEKTSARCKNDKFVMLLPRAADVSKAIVVVLRSVGLGFYVAYAGRAGAQAKICGRKVLRRLPGAWWKAPAGQA